MALTSDDVNYLIYRYLLESGLTHTAFAFAHETRVADANMTHDTVAPGALITFIQKGMQYLEMEANLNDDQSEIEPEFEILSARQLMTNDMAELRDAVRNRKAEARKEEERRRAKERARDAPVDTEEPELIPEEDLTRLEGHTHDVFVCAWNPVEPLVATGSGDATARIWDVAPGEAHSAPLVLKHVTAHSQDKSKDVTTLAWTRDGTLLASGAYDGNVHIWTKQGKELCVLRRHSAPISSLTWNASAALLLSGSVDKTAIIWDAKAREMKQQFCFHDGATLDVDWKDEVTFAFSSTDTRIQICKLGCDKPLQILEGHESEVEAVKWSPCGRLLASCSTDHTARIWTMQDGLQHILTGHSAGVGTLAWSPSGAGSRNPEQRLLLATASYDCTIKLWDPRSGACVRTLHRHTEPVYTFAFSPDGKHLASGSCDDNLHVWSVADGHLIKTCRGAGGVFDVSWNSESSRLAACFANRTLCVIDLRLKGKLDDCTLRHPGGGSL